MTWTLPGRWQHRRGQVCLGGPDACKGGGDIRRRRGKGGKHDNLSCSFVCYQLCDAAFVS